MRITLDIDEDVLQAAKARARREHKTVGSVVSELLRQALNAASKQTAVRERPTAMHGFRPFGPRGTIVTNDLINQLRNSDVY